MGYETYLNFSENFEHKNAPQKICEALYQGLLGFLLSH